jgi:hypothetical protein
LVVGQRSCKRRCLADRNDQPIAEGEPHRVASVGAMDLEYVRNIGSAEDIANGHPVADGVTVDQVRSGLVDTAHLDRQDRGRPPTGAVAFDDVGQAGKGDRRQREQEQDRTDQARPDPHGSTP